MLLIEILRQKSKACRFLVNKKYVYAAKEKQKKSKKQILTTTSLNNNSCKRNKNEQKIEDN